MDDSTYPYSDVDPPDTQPTFLDQNWREIEARRVRAQQVEDKAASHGELEQAVGLDAPGEVQALIDVPLPFATPPGAALTF